MDDIYDEVPANDAKSTNIGDTNNKEKTLELATSTMKKKHQYKQHQ
ncbi:8649_t:CDS:2 [Gigaspora margarita]|uniref:8649_t:CDS:1 n=1 Tax=Gigaspora margarita TaxID=4874 RepID=A0ABN7UTQ7_GIGMA|nr:8649_t:CDS:2 [Gigaspora margarita]